MIMKKFAILTLPLVFGVATALAAGHFAEPRPATLQARVQWAEVYSSPGGLVAGADLIVVARHLTAQPGRVVGTTPFTYNGFQIERTIKGAHEGDDLVVEQTGGRMADGMTLTIDDGGAFAPGRSYLLFLKAQGENGVYYQINHQARYEIGADGLLHGVDPTDRVVAAFNGQEAHGAIEGIERGIRRVQ
jgi:hypothetical protein